MLPRCILGLEKQKHRRLSLFLSEPGSENISLIGVFTHSVILNHRKKHRSGLAQVQGNRIIQSLFIRFSPGAKYRLFWTSSYSHVPFDLWAAVLFLLLHQRKGGVREQLQRWWRGCEQLRDYCRQTACRMFSLSLSLSNPSSSNRRKENDTDTSALYKNKRHRLSWSKCMFCQLAKFL